jgi:hypothetical protein
MSVMIQASVKDPLGNLYNVKAEGDEPDLVWTDFGSILNSIGGAELARSVRDTLGTSLTVTQGGAPAVPYGHADSLATAVANARPLTQPQVPAAATAPPQGGAPTCQHGTKQLVEKPAANGKNAWKAWGCPARRDDPTKCGLDFIRG